MKTVLVLEEEVIVMKLLRIMLKQYSLLPAASAEQALDCFMENQETIGLLIADVSVPGNSGIQVALHLRSHAQDLPVILTSCSPVSAWNAKDSADLEKLGAESVVILQKPFHAQLLMNTVRELVGSQRAQSGGPS
jgi:DNA-binding NtrC family response regulator